MNVQLTQRTRVAAYGLIVEDRSIVLCRIAAHVVEGGWWTLPGGGLKFGEDPADAMVREVYEETGLVVEPAGLAGLHSLHLVDDGHEFHAIRIIFWAKIIEGQLTYEVDGSTDRCDWIPFDDIDKLPMVDLVWAGIDIMKTANKKSLP